MFVHKLKLSEFKSDDRAGQNSLGQKLMLASNQYCTVFAVRAIVLSSWKTYSDILEIFLTHVRTFVSNTFVKGSNSWPVAPFKPNRKYLSPFDATRLSITIKVGCLVVVSLAAVFRDIISKRYGTIILFVEDSTYQQ